MFEAVLFPGTSTIQTRLRYMLFIPWIFSALQGRGEARVAAEQARADQIRLRDALVAGNQDVGVIGVNAGAKLKRLPASVYWSGLATWGIRRFPGSIDAYMASASRWKATAKDHPDDDHGAGAGSTMPWHPGLPAAPSDLLKTTTFKLSDHEAAFIVDRLVDSNRHLARLDDAERDQLLVDLQDALTDVLKRTLGTFDAS